MSTQQTTIAHIAPRQTVTVDTFKGEATGRVLFNNPVDPKLYGGKEYRALTLVFPNNRTWGVELPVTHPVLVEVPEAQPVGWACRCEGCVYGD